jgi:ketosteroid isomerase-like protein
MSQENVEIVRSIYEAVNRGDWDAAFRDQRADVELTTPPGPNAGTYRGREEIQGFWEEMVTPLEAWTAQPEEFFEHGDQIVAVVKARMRPKGSSAEFENRTGHLWTIRDGAVVSMRMFPQPEKALEAAGLSE